MSDGLGCSGAFDLIPLFAFEGDGLGWKCKCECLFESMAMIGNLEQYTRG
jgi:hypothetical protein